MKPLRPYPGHRGKKPTRRVCDPLHELFNAQAYGAQAHRSNQMLASQSSYWSTSACNQYNTNFFNAWPSAPASGELDRLDTEQSSGSAAPQATVPLALAPQLDATLLATVRAGFAEIRALTSRVFCRDRKGL